MRATLDAVLLFIGESSLTDIEWALIENEDLSTDAYKYATLKAVITARALVGNSLQRLDYYYIAKGLAVSSTSTANSNIFIGGVLESCDQ
jgi:hypothetical protein